MACMSALLHELVVPIADLTRLSVECARCGAVTTFDLALRIRDEMGRTIPPSVTSCSICHADFDTALKQRIRDLAVLLESLSGAKLAFRVPPPPEK